MAFCGFNTDALIDILRDDLEEMNDKETMADYTGGVCSKEALKDYSNEKWAYQQFLEFAQENRSLEWEEVLWLFYAKMYDFWKQSGDSKFQDAFFSCMRLVECYEETIWDGWYEDEDEDLNNES